MPRIPIQGFVPAGTVDTVGPGQIRGNEGAVGAAIGMVGRVVQQRQDAARAMQQRQQEDEARVAVTNLESETGIWAQQQMAEAAANGQMAGFTDRLLKDFDAKVKQGDASISPVGKGLYSQRMAQLRARLHERSFGAETVARQDKLVNDFEAGLDADRRLAFADPSQVVDLTAKRLALVETLNLPEGARAKMAARTREGLAFEAASALAERDPAAFLERAGLGGAKTGKDGKPLPSDPKKAAEAVKNDPILSNIDPDKMRVVIDRATMLKVTRDAQIAAEKEQRARQAEVAAAKREREANQAYTILSGWARDGITADPIAAKPLLDKIAGTPYASAYQEQTKQVAARTAVAVLPPYQQQARLDALYNQRAERGTSLQLETEIKESEQILKAADHDYRHDPLGAHIKRGLAQPVPLDFDDPASIKARAEQAQSVGAHLGHPVGILRPEESKLLADRFQKMAPAEKEEFVKSLYANVGPREGMATFAQLSKDAPLLAVAAGLSGRQTTGKPGTGMGRSVSQLMFEGEELLKQKVVHLPGGDRPENSAKLAEQWQEVAGDAIPQPAARQAAISATASVYAKLMHEAGRVNEKEVDRRVWKQASDFVTGGVIAHNGAKILPPGYGMQADQARDLLRGVTAKNVADWGGVYGMTNEQAAEYIRSAVLESQTIGKYRVKAGAGILQRQDGRPFEMTYTPGGEPRKR